ncbi:Lysosomal thioesterase PPT2-B [Phytophthora nicotianae]|uniref:Lysosomal thioesterase PPT2-B n=1 Tax=Phytophthora nicotianae TaxID=4792 RepID=A0A0W8CNR6_PHYNI|nr:Lysosomal thioesterase PPT2-B [Phytophthora nicotianae]
MAYSGEEATIVLSGIGTELSDGMLMNMYRTYGPIVRVRHNGTNSAQVVFAQKQHAQRAMEATNGAVVYGKTLKVSLQRKFKKTTEPCRGFAAGICRQGDMCKYYHSESDSDDEAPSKPVVKQTKKPQPKTPMAKSKPAASSWSSSSSSDSSEDEAPAKPVKPTPAPRRNHKAGGISEGSSHTLVKKIEAFNESGEGTELHLDANLNGFERLLAHDCAERLGLAHESIGSGLERHIIISRHGTKRAATDSSHSHKSKKSKHRH